MMYGDGFYGGFGIIGGLFMLVFWVLVAIAIVSFIRMLLFSRCPDGKCGGRHGFFSGYSEEDSAFTILKERFAKGEIDKTEYLERKKTLEEGTKK